MHPRATVDRALRLSEQGLIDCEVARITGVSIGAVQKWRTGHRRTPDKERKHASCPRCHGAKLNERAYAYLLGLYLGDGHISQHRRGVRGLIHSDGYRGVNRVRRVFADGEHWYEYPRYLFSNKSLDILALCSQALDRLSVEWRFARWDVISVAKRDAVALLDAFVGPKY